MTKEQHVDALLRTSKNRKTLTARIDALHDQYLEHPDQMVYEQLVELLTDYCRGWICNHLHNAGLLRNGNEEIVLQEGHLAVWQVVSEELRLGTRRENFPYYAFGIYNNKVQDLIRKESRTRAKEFTVLDDEDDDRPNDEPSDTGPGPDELAEEAERRRLYARIFRLYCRCFLLSDAFPPKLLALCYARVLPHIDCRIPDSKATSAKWAFETMGDRTVLLLKEESEQRLHSEVQPGMAWGEPFVAQLEQKIETGVLLRDAVYTALYAKNKIEDWADSMHNATMRSAMKELQSDRKLMRMVIDYAAGDRTLSRFTANAKERSR